jgi:hypothetical protein
MDALVAIIFLSMHGEQHCNNQESVAVVALHASVMAGF